MGRHHYKQGETINKEIQAIREGKLSPLAIKRPPTKLQKQNHTPKQFQSIKNQTRQLDEILKRNTRIIAITTPDAGIIENTEAEKRILNANPTSFNLVSRELADTAAERYRNGNPNEVIQWRSIFYKWEQVKHIPTEIRMENPFQHGNMCEDPERHNAIRKKQNNPSEVLCPTCPVYNACQERGYLSQSKIMHKANIQISPSESSFSIHAMTNTYKNCTKLIKTKEYMSLMNGIHSLAIYLSNIL